MTCFLLGYRPDERPDGHGLERFLALRLTWEFGHVHTDGIKDSTVYKILHILVVLDAKAR